jgi:dTDP-glucose 4,6-dehydratase
MNVLIYGSNGWIGQQFTDIMTSNKISYVCGKQRVDDETALLSEIDAVAPTHIISFIGRTHGKIDDKVYTTIDYLEQDGKLVDNVRDNLFSPLLLAELCKRRGIHYTYLGTGCIFKYDGPDEFTEACKPNFFGSSYSIVKGFTDRLMHLYDDSVLNLRIRMPITAEKNPRNFITKITSYERICSISNSMTVLPELLPIALDMMKNKTTGTINLTNPGTISHNEILEMYKEIVDPTFTWANFSQAEQRLILASDRSNNCLSTNKLSQLYPQVKPIQEAVRECLVKYKSSLVNILVTGGCGFIGSNFINGYFSKHPCANIINLDAMYYCASETNVDAAVRNSNRYTFVKGNLCDADLITRLLEKHNVTHVINFAAQSHVDNSFNNALLYTTDNVLGTHTLLDCCRRYNRIRKFIHVSTDEVYGESVDDAKTEMSILCPTNPYAATKAGAELIAQAYCRSFHMPIIITRGNNVYGPNQYPEKVIPLFIKLLNENKKLTIQGDGSCLRAFLHVFDTVAAFECILEKGVAGEIYNIGCDEDMEYSIMDVAKKIIQLVKHTDNYDDWIEYIADRPFNDRRYYITNTKLKTLGWTPTVHFDDGLKMLVNV